MKKTLLFLLTTIFLNACKAPSNEKQYQVIMPTGLENYSPDPAKKDLLSGVAAKAKIFTLVDVSCSTCILKLEQWNKFQRELIAKKVLVVPVCYAKDKFEILKYLFESGKIVDFRLSLYLDEDRKFINANKGLVSQFGVLNVLTDAENHILADGDPIEDENVRSQYLKIINEQ